MARFSPRLAVCIGMVAALACTAHCQALPSAEECQSRAASIGNNGLLLQLSSCQGGPTAACCQQVQGLVGFPGSGQLAGCLCDPAGLEQTLSTVETNSLAKSVGVTRDTVKNVLTQCGAPFAGGSGANACPAAGGASAPPAQSGSPAPAKPSTPEKGPTPAPATPAPAPATAGESKLGVVGGKLGGIGHPLLRRERPVLNAILG